tara:strand:+ start:3003 stop:3596 length:594 start_codon:yes stop_codon:yes gene_type:complete
MIGLPRYNSLHRGGLLAEQAHGFTLIEMLVAIVSSLILVGAAYTFLTQQEKSFGVEADVSQTQRDVRTALKTVVTLLRPAGYNPDNVPAFRGLSNISSSFLQINNENVTISFVDAEAEIQIVRSPSGNTARLPNITNLTFVYYAANGAELDPSLADPADVRVIEVTVRGETKTGPEDDARVITEERTSRVTPLNLAL